MLRIPRYTWDEDLVYSDAIEVYTDGSFDGSHAGWAAAIIFHQPSTWGLLGVLSGSVVDGSSTTFGVGINRVCQPKLPSKPHSFGRIGGFLDSPELLAGKGKSILGGMQLFQGNRL